MNVCTKAMKLGVGVASVVAWLVLIASTLHRLIAGATPHWCAATMSLAAVTAVTATVVLVIVHTLPTVFEAWQRGVEYGRRTQARRVEGVEVPHPRVPLHSVK